MSTPLWKQIQKQNFTSFRDLFSFLEIKDEKPFHLKPKFPLNVPRRLAEKIRKNSLDDPILRQFVPLEEETALSSQFKADPVCDQEFRKEKKLLHKYRGRALLLCTSACAMHCRFCFRQNFPYETEQKGFEKELQIIAEDPSLTEIILSGGDPLSLSNKELAQLFSDLSKIPHLKIVRFHTRFPIGIPERIDPEFLTILKQCSLQIFFVVHVNHYLELDNDVLLALKSIRQLGIPLLTQTVLLQGVNDTVCVLKALFEKLIENGIVPYYLHQLDQVQGGMHFEVEQSKGVALMMQLKELLPGYALPKYVKEEAHKKHKSDLLLFEVGVDHLP
ncbi:MAG TPA: KamA family radical SAM protein [Rhabdochlamydiaceae bacterium]|nr:KamA family radical SAM protein [Rhabdochlamydiaceae bacterium]